MKLIVIVLLISFLLGLFALSSGIYNVAATNKHWAITEKVIVWTRESSINARAKDLEVPPFDDKSMLSIGAQHYGAMCAECHLAPGQEPTELAVGLYPQAPVFHQRVPVTDSNGKQDHAKEHFWVIKNGLKMTAMPAWGLTHDDETIWAITAFVEKLGGMTAEQYTKLVGSHDDHGHDHHH